MKKKILWSSYSVFIIIALALLLIFQTNSTESESESSVTYANSLSLNVSSSISVPVASTFEFESGFITVSPADATQFVTCEISSGGSGLALEDGKFVATKTGSYVIKYSVPKSDGNILSASVAVKVVEEASSPSLNISTLKISEVVAVSEIFDVEEDTELSISVDSDKITYENEQLTAVSDGETEIEVTFVQNYVKITQTYSISILPADFYDIRINDIQYDGNYCTISYQVLNNDEEAVVQKVNVDVDNSEVLIIGDSAPLIILYSPVSVVKLTLSLEGEETTLTITLNFAREQI